MSLTEPSDLIRYHRPLIGDMPSVTLPTGRRLYFGQNLGHEGRGKPDPMIRVRESKLALPKKDLNDPTI